jgi:hypothetical protein
VRESPLFTKPTALMQGVYFVGAWNGSGGFQPTLESGSSAARLSIREMKV